MANSFQKAEKVGTTAETASPQHITRNPQLLDFEKSLGDLSAAFIRVSVEEVDDEIERWLQKIVLALDLDLGTVAQIEPADGTLYITHQSARKGVSIQEKGLNGSQAYPWLAEKVLRGELVVISRIAELPPEASKDLAAFRRGGTKSDITIPLRIGGAVVGAMSYGTILSERTWTQKEIQRLKLVAEVFGNALERKRAFAKHRRLSEELRQVSQVVTMGQLTASLAHELNQPLGAILNNARAVRRLLASKTPDLTEIDCALEDIIRDDDRAVETIRNVRAMFRRGEDKMASVDIKQLLLDIKRIVDADAFAKNISLSMEIPDSLPAVMGNKGHLMQAILNVLFNAFDSVCESEGPREVVIRADQTEPGNVRLSVQDSGKGIESKVLPHLFAPFFTTKSKGMGMGLAIVKSIIENHGGRIQATQNPDRGATIEFVLPVEPKTGHAGQ